MGKFSNVFGHQAVRNRLGDALTSNPTGSYLLHGPSSVGKRTVAFEASRYVLCNGSKDDNCSCDSCHRFGSDHPDFFSAGVGERVKVKDVDTLLEFCQTMPFISEHKVAVVDNAEDMTYEAANRLLKILEEPPEYMTFFLVTANPKYVLHTVRSRCLHFQFGSIERQDLINVFWKKLGFDLPEARILGWIGAGSSVDVFSKAGTYLKHRRMALDLISGIKGMSLLDVLDFVDKIIWKELTLFVDMLVMVLTDVILLQNGIDEIVNADSREDLKVIATKFHDKALVTAVSHISQAKEGERYHANLNLGLKNTIIRSWPLLTAEVK